jgi:hypothetical protein
MLQGNCDHRRPGQTALGRRVVLAVILALCLAAAAGASPSAARGPTYRIFLTDGTALVSYGLYSRAAGSIVFTVPVGVPSRPDGLQVVTLPESVVDWERPERYADAVRHQRYADTRGEEDYAALTAAVARALGDIGFAPDAPTKLAIAADIRRQLLEWPASHFGYRSADVRELTAHMEEAISDIRAGSGQRAFDLSLVAMIQPPSEPLLPEPTLKDSLESANAVARMLEGRRERMSLQQSILTVLDGRKRELPRSWRAGTRKALSRTVNREITLDREYADLASRAIHDAREREARADVASLMRLQAEVQIEDRVLGYRRPEVMNGLLATLATSMDRARQRRMAIERYEYRTAAFGSYRRRVETSCGQFGDVMPAINSVKMLSGLDPRRLAKAEKRVSSIEVGLLPIAPPDDLRATHELLLSSARLMREALRLHRGAAISGDMASAQNASAAAAGAILLFDTARNRIDEYFRRPAPP